MASTNTWMVLFYLTMSLFGNSMGAHYKIGDILGWTAAGTVDYTNWASTKNFRVGDELDFQYDNQFHNVMEVNRKDFESCNSSSPILTYTSGHDSIELTSTHHHYYICGIPGHCDAGQKVDIFVRDNDCGPNIISPPDHNSASPSTPFLQFNRLFGTKLGISFVVSGLFLIFFNLNS